MKWISFAKLENFKVHREIYVEFDPYLNVITGIGDVGKTTLLKGMIKCLFNQPGSKAETFMSWGSKRGAKTRIWIGIKDDHNGKYSIENAPEHIIERVLGKSTNEYNLTYPDGSVQTYANFGRKVPPEVTSIHGMREVDMGYGKEQLNYMSQFDSFFLLGRRPEEVAVALGRLAQTKIIDKVKDGLRSDISSNTRKIGELNKAILAEEDKLTQYEHLPELLESINSVEEIIEFIEGKEKIVNETTNIARKIKNSASNLKSVCDKLKGQDIDYESAGIHLGESEQLCKIALETERSVIKISNYSEKLSDACEILDKSPDFEVFDEIEARLTRGVNLIKEVESIESRIKRRSRDLVSSNETLENIPDLTGFDGLVDEMTRRVESIGPVTTTARKIKTLAGKLAESSLSLKRCELAAEEARVKFEESLGGRCPTCGEEINEDSMAQIEMHLSE